MFVDKIIEFITQFIDKFIPFEVLAHFERGVVLRLGKFHREVGPGLRWHWPLGFEVVMSDNVVPRTVNLGAQSLTTKDSRNVTVGGVVTACIRDIKTALLEVEGVDHALEDSCYGAIGALVASHSWDEITQESFSDKLTKACRKQAWKYGIEIQRVQLSDLTLARAIRLIR